MILDFSLENLIYTAVGFLAGIVGPLVINWIKGKVQQGEEKNQTEANKEQVDNLTDKVDDISGRLSKLEGKTKD